MFTQFAAPERAPHPQHGQPGDARGAYLALPFGTFSGVGAGRQNNKPKPGARLGQTSRWMGAAVMAACLAGPWSARAQAPRVEPPPGAVPTPEQLSPALPNVSSEAALPERPPARARELGKPGDELTLDVAGYRVDADAPAALRAALPALTAPYAGKNRSYEDLVNATVAVTRFLQRDLGFYLGYAFLPEQDPQDGIVRIAVLEGRLDQVSLQWPENMPLKREVVEAYLSRLKPGEILHVRDVERVVFLVNDLRGLTARFEVKAGRMPGTASLVVTVQPEARLATRVDVDTLGSRYSGVGRISVLGTIASPTGRGDGLVLNALTTTTRGLKFALAGYTLPVGADGLKLGASVSFVQYQLDETELPLDLHGDATSLTTYALYPVVRSRNLNLFALASFNAKRYEDKQGATGLSARKKVNDLQLSVSGDARDDMLSGGVNTFELSLTHGKVTLGNRAANDNPPNFTLARLNVTRLQNLVDGRLLLYAALRSQVAADNLDNVAQFQLGGADRVRAFAPGEGTGDEGVAVTAELRFLPPERWFGRIAREMVFSAFIDAGRVRFRHRPSPIVTSRNAASLAGCGVGAIWDRPNDFALRAYLAWPLEGEAKNDPVVKKPRAYITATKHF